MSPFGNEGCPSVWASSVLCILFFSYLCDDMDEQWKRQLRREASAHHMCAENRDALSCVETKLEAIQLYKKTIDWALEEGFPDIHTLRRDFSDCEDYGIFVGRHFNGERLTEQQVYVFHECTGMVRVGLNLRSRIIPMLYFANGCDMTVRGIRNSAMQIRVPLYVFGDNHVAGEQSDDIFCKVYYYDVK